MTGMGSRPKPDHDRPAGVVHILPYDLARGAQRYARALIDALAAEGERHQILTLFRAEPVLLRPDVELDVPMGPLRRIGLDPRAVLRLRREVKRLRPAVVVAHGGESAKYAALALPRNVPLVYLKIGTAHRALQRRANKSLHGFYTRRADVVAAVSSDVADEAHRLYEVPRDRLVVIPNARDPVDFPPRSPGQNDPPRLIFVGHLDPGKRPDWFIDVVAELRGAGKEFQAVMVGDGPLQGSLRSRAEVAGVEMLGRRGDVPELLAGSDIFVFTSLPPGEGMPGVLIEAGLAGLATVSTRVPGARDVIDDGVTGLLVDVEDKAGMTSAVGRLVDEEETREAMGKGARDRCLEMFSLQASVDRWHQVLGPLMRLDRV
jgi:glycosyltransferase involved in cell wall biosynthesis